MLKKITKWETEDGKVFDTQEEAEDYMFEQEKEVMTHISTEQPEALRLAAMYDYGDPFAHGNQWKVAVCTELRRLHARVQELEAAPVDLPEPSVVVICELEKAPYISSVFGISYGANNLYTEQQVIDLLKSVGVSVKP